MYFRVYLVFLFFLCGELINSNLLRQCCYYNYFVTFVCLLRSDIQPRIQPGSREFVGRNLRNCCDPSGNLHRPCGRAHDHRPQHLFNWYACSGIMLAVSLSLQMNIIILLLLYMNIHDFSSSTQKYFQ